MKRLQEKRCGRKRDVLKSNQRDKIKDKISGCPHRTNG
jgi:hypothetical protein